MEKENIMTDAQLIQILQGMQVPFTPIFADEIDKFR